MRYPLVFARLSIRPRCGQGGRYGSRGGRGQVGQGVQGARLIEQADVSVDPERQSRGRMPGQGLDDLDRGVAYRQRRDE